jgi:hypothetical protein
MHEKSNLIFIPTGEEIHQVSGKIDYLTYGIIKYNIPEQPVANPEDVVVITQLPGVLKIRIVPITGNPKSITTSHGKPDTSNDIIEHPPAELSGLPDEHLELDNLGKRYLNRLFLIAKKDLGKIQSKSVFASTAKDDDRFDDLMNSLNALGNKPKTEVSKGIPPSNARIAATPTIPSTTAPEAREAIIENSRKLSRAQAAVSLYSNIWSIAMRTKRGHPEPYKISVPAEASQLNADDADATVAALDGPLSGYFSKEDSGPGFIRKTMTTADIHVEFLKTFFDSWGFSDDKLTELDNVLKEVADLLSSLKVSATSTVNSISHTMSTRGFRKVIFATDRGEDDIVAYEPLIRVTYLSVAQRSFELSVGVKNTVTYVDFDMNYADQSYILNVDVFDEVTPGLDEVINKLTSKNLEEFGNGTAWVTAEGQTKPKA